MNAMNVWATTALWYHSKHQIKVMWIVSLILSRESSSERHSYQNVVWVNYKILDQTYLTCPLISYKPVRYRVDLVKRFHADLATGIVWPQMIPCQFATKIRIIRLTYIHVHMNKKQNPILSTIGIRFQFLYFS